MAFQGPLGVLANTPPPNTRGGGNSPFAMARQAATAADPWSGMRSIGAMPQAAPMAPQQQQSRRFNPYRPGSIMWGLTGPGLPTREEARIQEVGEARGRAYQKLTELVSQGMPMQQAVVQFIQTPEGVDFVSTDPDPETAMTQFLKLLETPSGTRADVFGGGMGGQPMPQEAAPQPAGPAGPGTMDRMLSGQPMEQDPTGMGMGQIQPPPEQTFNAMPPGTNSAQLRLGAQRLAQEGDDEGARLALSLAEQYDKLDDPQDLIVVPDPSAPSGARLIPKRDAAGLPAFPPSSLVTLEDKRDGATDQAMAEYYVKRLTKEIDEPAQAAREMLPNVEAFRSGLRAQDFEPGAAGGLRKTFSQWADFLGFDMNDPKIASRIGWLGLGNPATAEQMEGSANLIAETMAGSMSRVSNLSINLLKTAGPELVKTREGNELLLTLLETTAQRTQQVASFKERYISEAYAKGERPNFPQMFSELEQLRSSWKPMDQELTEKMRSLATEGKKRSFKSLADQEGLMMEEEQKIPEFATEKELDEWVAKDPATRRGRRVKVDGVSGTAN